MSKKGVIGVQQQNGATNGLIPSSICLSLALLFFVGGSPYDIAVSHGISVPEVYRSVWRVVDAIHETKELKIVFPNHAEQQTIANTFKEQSDADFPGVVGCVDGM